MQITNSTINSNQSFGINTITITEGAKARFIAKHSPKELENFTSATKKLTEGLAGDLLFTSNKHEEFLNVYFIDANRWFRKKTIGQPLPIAHMKPNAFGKQDIKPYSNVIQRIFADLYSTAKNFTFGPKKALRKMYSRLDG